MSSLTTPSEYITQISHWFTSHGGLIHPSVEITHYPSSGYSLRVRPAHHLPASSCVISCPHTLVLSVLNLPHSSHPWPKEFLSRWATSPEVLTRVFLMEEFLRGEESGWWSYLRMLPQPGGEGLDTPLWYGEEDCAWIRGTNLEGARVARAKQWREEYEECVGILGRSDELRCGLLSGKWELYKWAATILTSRCFSSAAFRMTQGEPLPITSSDVEMEGANVSGPALARFPILLPVFDIANHDPCASVTWGWENSACSFTVNQDIPAGKEICISYDNKSNEEREYVPSALEPLLLEAWLMEDMAVILGYGFSLFRNAQDTFGLVLKNVSASKTLARVVEARRASHREKDGSTLKMDHLPTTFHLRPAPANGDFFAANPTLTSAFSLLVANHRFLRELRALQPFPHHLPTPLPSSPSTRHATAITSTLLVSLLHKHAAIDIHTPALPPYPLTPRHFHAARYRRRQLHILATNIACLRARLRAANTATTRLMRLEDLLAASTSASNRLRAGIHHVLRTRSAVRVREAGWGEMVFTLWVCGCWVARGEGGVGTGWDGWVGGEGGWLGWVGGVYGTPDGGRRSGCEAGGTRGLGGGEADEGESEEEKRAIAESYLDVVRAIGERYPEGVFAREGWGVEMLMWGRDVVLEEGLVVPGDGEGMGEFVVFVSRDRDEEVEGEDRVGGEETIRR